jgi:hypothetical protein
MFSKLLLASEKLLLSIFSCCVNLLTHHPMLRGVKVPFGLKDIAKKVLNYLIRSPFKVTKGKKKMSFTVFPYLKHVGSCPICILENFFFKAYLDANDK